MLIESERVHQFISKLSDEFRDDRQMVLLLARMKIYINDLEMSAAANNASHKYIEALRGLSDK